MTEIKIVIGANFGDEGKGLVSNFLSKEAKESGNQTIVVLSNGGAQRGHTVKTDTGIRHVFHHFGSGTFQNAASYYPKEFILNPMRFLSEYEELKCKKITPVCYVNKECLVSTPYDCMMNQILEENRGDKKHGSCGMGIWETIVRNGKKVGEMYGLSRMELYDYVKEIRDVYLPKRLFDMGITSLSKEWDLILKDDDMIVQYVEDFFYMMDLVFQGSNHFVTDDCLHNFDTIIFENGQGLLLDQNRVEFGDHTTPSNTGLNNPKRILDVIIHGKQLDIQVFYVTRTYMTRHGAGEFDTECSMSEINEEIEDHTNIWNPHQGTIRYGKLIATDLFHRIQDDYRVNDIKGAKYALVVTHINEYAKNLGELTDMAKSYDYDVYYAKDETNLWKT